MNAAGRTDTRIAKTSRAALASLALAGAIALAGCGDDEESTATATANATAAEGKPLEEYLGKPDASQCEGKEYVIGYSTWSDTETFTKIFNEAQQEVASKVGCVEIVQLLDNADPGQAVQNAKVLAQRKVDAALTLNVIAAAAPAQARTWKQAKIPAASLLVRLPDGAPFATVDEKKAGRSAGENLGKAFAEAGSGADGYAIVGRWDQSGQNGIDRMDAVTEGITSAVPDLPSKNILKVDTKGEPPTAQSATLGVLNKIPKGSKIMLVGQNDQLSNAMFKAAEQAGRSSDVMVGAIGGARPEGLNFVCDNPQYAGVEAFFPEKWADYTIPMLIGLAQGKAVPETVTLPTQFLTADTIKDAYPDFECGEK